MVELNVDKSFENDNKNINKEKDKEKNSDNENFLHEGEDINDWLDLLDNKEILKKQYFLKDKNAPRVNRRDCIKINLETRNFETNEIIESECFKNFEIIVGDYDIIHGLDLILPMMHLTETSIVLINSRFAYGPKGKHPDVPPNCRLKCLLEVIEIVCDYVETKSLNEKIELIKKKKEKGNFWFNREEYTTAINSYKKSLDIFENVDSIISEDKDLYIEEIKSLCNLKSIIYSNLSLTQLKIGLYKDSLESINESLNFDPKNVKALYRKSCLLELNGELKEAINLIHEALKLNKKNTFFLNKLIILKEKSANYLETEKQLFKKMINLTNEENEKLVENSSLNYKEKKFNILTKLNSKYVYIFTILIIFCAIFIKLIFI